jgi:hypothetical protein
MRAYLPPLLKLIVDGNRLHGIVGPPRTHIAPLLAGPEGLAAERPPLGRGQLGRGPPFASQPRLSIVPEGFDADAPFDGTRGFPDMITGVDAQAAVAMATHLLKENPGRADLFSQRAVALATIGKAPDALRDFERALAIETLTHRESLRTQLQLLLGIRAVPRLGGADWFTRAGWSSAC